MTTFFTIEEIKRANFANGYHWFRSDTMKFWNSRISGPVIANMFVSSEDDFRREHRLYTIRKANDDGSIDTVGEFQQYETKAQALAALKRIAKEG